MSDPGVRTMLAVRGSMVAVSSIAALRAPSGSAAYAVSKAGLVMPAQTVARDLAARGGAGQRRLPRLGSHRAAR